jgi:hypothetical protein
LYGALGATGAVATGQRPILGLLGLEEERHVWLRPGGREENYLAQLGVVGEVRIDRVADSRD